MSILDENFDFSTLQSESVFDDNSGKNFEKDERFYVLEKDKEGKGAALIRFLIDKEKKLTKHVKKINTTIVQPNGKKRFVSEFSPSTIGLPCPFQELSGKYFNAGDKESALKFNTGDRFIANIKVLKDPKNPANEGKIFLFEMSNTMHEKIKRLMKPTQEDLDMQAKIYVLDNPMDGHSFRLISQRGSNGQINYDASGVVEEKTSIYSSREEAVNDIINNTYTLSEFDKAEAYKSYDVLKDKLNWVQGNNNEGAQSAQTVQTVQTAQPAQSAQSAQTAQTVQTAQPVQTTQTAQISLDELNAAASPSIENNQDKSLDDLLGDLV